MRVCPKCGYVDSMIWRPSRARRMVDIARYVEFKEEFPDVKLEVGKPIQIGDYAYKLTKAGVWVERQCVLSNPFWKTQWNLDYEGHKKKTWFPFGKSRITKNQTRLLEVTKKQ